MDFLELAIEQYLENCILREDNLLEELEALYVGMEKTLEEAIKQINK